MRHLVASGEVEAAVCAPVPWFPRSLGRVRSYGELSRVPPRETRGGIHIEHPRFPVIPKIGMNVAPFLMYHAVKRQVRRWVHTNGTCDLIDAHVLYPDGVVAAMLGRSLGLPVALTARGSDVNVAARYPVPRRLILRAGQRAAVVITVSDALRHALTRIGVDPHKITTVRNGVDPAMFAPVERIEARRSLGVTGTVLLCVGNLLEAKGQHLVVRSLRYLPDATLLLAGAGSGERSLRRLVGQLGVADRVRFLGWIPHDRLRRVYGAADVSVLASKREGCPNVVLESLACGTPVVATNVGGVPEVLDRRVGRIVDERTPEALAAGVRQLLAHPPDRATVRAWAEPFSWDATTRGQLDLFGRVAAVARSETGRTEIQKQDSLNG